MKELTLGYLRGELPEDREKQCQCPNACTYTPVGSISGSNGLNADEKNGWGNDSNFSSEWNSSHFKIGCRTTTHCSLCFKRDPGYYMESKQIDTSIGNWFSDKLGGHYILSDKR